MPTPERTDGASFPKMKQLRDVLPMELQNVADLIPSVLLTPIEDLLSRPKKNLRGRLVELGFEFAGGDRTIREGAEVCAKCVDILEMLHAGSLVIDDIQDGSLLRRGSPALHERYGLPIALNAGNWLYFWPLEIVRTLGLPAEREVQIYRAYHRTMMRAHVGQALDVGTPIDQLATDRVYDLCLASLQLKTGTLTAFAFAIGAIAVGISEIRLEQLLTFGNHFGVALQMFDDLGNASGAKDPTKKWEDLKLRRPTWLWAAVVSFGTSLQHLTLKAAVARLPDETGLTRWFLKNSDFVEESYRRAIVYLEDSHTALAKAVGDEPSLKAWLAEAKSLENFLTQSYH